MSTLREFADFAVEEFDLFIKIAHQHVILWTETDDSDGLVPIAHVKLDEMKEYSLNYPTFKRKYSDADQIKIAAEVINFANTPLENRDN